MSGYKNFRLYFKDVNETIIKTQQQACKLILRLIEALIDD